MTVVVPAWAIIILAILGIALTVTNTRLERSRRACAEADRALSEAMRAELATRADFIAAVRQGGLDEGTNAALAAVMREIRRVAGEGP